MSWTYRLAGLLRYAAVQFIVLTAFAMTRYAGGTWWDPYTPRYHFTDNFLSDLGMTHSFSGRSNLSSLVPFAIALATVGLSLVAFAWCWKGFAFERGRARWVGHASALLGTLSGLCFTGVACTPFDLALTAHNMLVIAAFGFLMLYVATGTIVMWRNGITGIRIGVNLAYLALVVGYVVMVVEGPTWSTPYGHRVQVVDQKIVAYGSMLMVLFLTTSTRRALFSRRAA